MFLWKNGKCLGIVWEVIIDMFSSQERFRPRTSDSAERDMVHRWFRTGGGPRLREVVPLAGRAARAGRGNRKFFSVSWRYMWSTISQDMGEHETGTLRKFYWVLLSRTNEVYVGSVVVHINRWGTSRSSGRYGIDFFLAPPINCSS